MPCLPFQERLHRSVLKTILSLNLLFVALFHGMKRYQRYEKNRKPVSENKFRVIRVLLQSLDYAVVLACLQATLMLKKM